MASRMHRGASALASNETDDLCVMRCLSLSSPSPSPAPASTFAPPFRDTSASCTVGSWTSGACSLRSGPSVCSSDFLSGFSLVSFKDLDPALSESHSTLPSSSFLLDLQLSAQDIMTGSHSTPLCYREPQWVPAEDDLSLSPPGSPSLAPTKTISAITWAAKSQETDGGPADKQPWKGLWPPTLGSSLFTWVASERPDVLAFAFDPNNHLLHQNHPWQAWKDGHPAVGEPSEDEGTLLDPGELRSALSGPRPETCPVSTSILARAVQQAREELDDLIQVDLQLPSVTPKQFNYLRPLRQYLKERPYRLQLPAGLLPIPVTNVFAKSYPVRIHDISGYEDKFTLDVSGFQFMKCPITVGEWNDQAVTEAYLPALLDWAVDLLGGDSGLVYSFNFRHHSSDRFMPVQRPWHTPRDKQSLIDIFSVLDTEVGGEDGEDDECYSINRYLRSDKRDDHYNNIYAVEADPSGPCRWKKPFIRVHCDASENTHKRRLPILRPDDSEALLRGRVREISVWRKLSECVQDTPLALCDARTVDPEDLVPMDVVYPHFADEVYEVLYNKNHRWFYKKDMDTEDVAVFKLHDTHSTAAVCPHSAFLDPSVPGDTPPRLSIEVKIMIFGG